MRIAAVTISIDYADLLAQTLVHNRGAFDDFVVVTAPDDAATPALCASFDVQLCVSRRRTLHGAAFNRGALLNDGFRIVRDADWVAVLDADIVLPAAFASMWRGLVADEHTLHYARRLQCPTLDEWRRAESNWSTLKLFEDDCPGAGYFQLFSARARRLNSRGLWYPEYYPTAAASDLRFRDIWPASRDLGFPVVHLGEAFVNWSGRRSPAFA